MLTIIFIIYILTIMSQTMPTIHTIKNFPRSDRTQEMVLFVRHNEKLARTVARSDFLVDCRKLDIMPKFILDRIAHVKTDNTKITRAAQRLKTTIRNEEIRSAFKTKAYLRRCLDRSASFLQGDPRWPWLYGQGRQIFEEELSKSRHKLLDKICHLLRDQKGELLRPRLGLQLTRSEYRSTGIPDNYNQEAHESQDEDEDHHQQTVQQEDEATAGDVTTLSTTRPGPTCATHLQAQPATYLRKKTQGDTARTDRLPARNSGSATSAAAAAAAAAGERTADIERQPNDSRLHTERPLPMTGMNGMGLQLKVWNLIFWIVKCVMGEWPVITVNDLVISVSRGIRQKIGIFYADQINQHRMTMPSDVPASQIPSRVTNLSDEFLDQDTLELLGRGPSFALGRSVNAATLHMVEVGVQRAIYGLKWTEHIEEKRNRNTGSNENRNDCSHDTTDSLVTDEDVTYSTLPRPHFPDSYACQPLM